MESLSPFLQGSFIPYNMPVDPGAQRIVADPSLWPRLGGVLQQHGLGVCRS